MDGRWWLCVNEEGELKEWTEISLLTLCFYAGEIMKSFTFCLRFSNYEKHILKNFGKIRI